MIKFKVYGGCGMINGKQRRIIISTTSMKRVAEIAGYSLSYLYQYWCETGNEEEIEFANKHKEKLCYSNLNDSEKNKKWEVK